MDSTGVGVPNHGIHYPSPPPPRASSLPSGFKQSRCRPFPLHFSAVDQEWAGALAAPGARKLLSLLTKLQFRPSKRILTTIFTAVEEHADHFGLTEVPLENMDIHSTSLFVILL